uniref:Lipoprotein n=1 Tax=Borrelia hermsii TaxID=140 RepID=S4VUA9_BORHE|nr:hypothetical protein BHA022 [Borrelia hermsii]
MKYKIFIIFILTGLLLPLLALVSCNSEPEKTEGVKLGAKLNANTPTPKPGGLTGGGLRKLDPPPKPGGGATDPGNSAGNHPGGGATDPGSGAGNHPGGGATDPGGGATTGPSGGATSPGGGATDPNGGATDPGSGGSGAGNHPGGGADQQDEAEKQDIIDYFTKLMHQGIKKSISIHNDTTWSEVGESYNLQTSAQFFGVIQYTDAKKQKKLYNTQDDESKTARREMYLAFEYLLPYIEAFGALANKMAAAQNVQMKTELTNMVKKIRQYARAFYLTACNPLIKKQDKLMELDLSDLQTLKAKVGAINTEYKNINFLFINSIYNDYYNNIEIGTAKHTLQDNATAEEIQAYLNGKFTSVESEFNTVIKEAPDVAGILNKIQ